MTACVDLHAWRQGKGGAREVLVGCRVQSHDREGAVSCRMKRCDGIWRESLNHAEDVPLKTEDNAVVIDEFAIGGSDPSLDRRRVR
eukprot:1797802-Amphidinium_carterae.1